MARLKRSSDARQALRIYLAAFGQTLEVLPDERAPRWESIDRKGAALREKMDGVMRIPPTATHFGKAAPAEWMRDPNDKPIMHHKRRK